jgi:hypothetical protein
MMNELTILLQDGFIIKGGVKLVILATTEAEIGRIVVQGQLGKKVQKTSSGTMIGHGDQCLSSQLCVETQIKGWRPRSSQGIKQDPISKITNA